MAWLSFTAADFMVFQEKVWMLIGMQCIMFLRQFQRKYDNYDVVVNVCGLVQEASRSTMVNISLLTDLKTPHPPPPPQKKKKKKSTKKKQCNNQITKKSKVTSKELVLI